MFEFEVIQNLKPNDEILESIKNYEYKVKYEYRVNEIANKSFYIKEHKQKYNLKEIKQILIKLNI